MSQEDAAWLAGNELAHLLIDFPARFNFLAPLMGDVGLLYLPV